MKPTGRRDCARDTPEHNEAVASGAEKESAALFTNTPCGLVHRRHAHLQCFLLYAFEASSRGSALRSSLYGHRGEGRSGAAGAWVGRFPAGHPSIPPPMRDQSAALIGRHVILHNRTRNGRLLVRSIVDNTDELRRRPFEVIDAPRIGAPFLRFGRSLRHQDLSASAFAAQLLSQA
jgi:hypothetical protein